MNSSTSNSKALYKGSLTKEEGGGEENQKRKSRSSYSLSFIPFTVHSSAYVIINNEVKNYP